MSSSTKELVAFPGSEHALKKPWAGIQVCDETKGIYALNVKPINHGDWTEITKKGMPFTGLAKFGNNVINANKALLSSSDAVTVVLDGRINIFSQGYLGDLVEATRIVDPLLQAGKKVRIVTSHTDIFDESNSNIEIHGFPADIPPANQYPWEPRLLSFIGKVTQGDPVIFPLNARVPLAFDIKPGGKVSNISAISDLNGYLNQSDRQIGIRHEKWAKQGVHQLQALQGFVHLLGLSALDWQQFPNAHLFPDRYSLQTAKEVIKGYGCFYAPEKGTPLFLHPGVATDGKKINLKGYSEDAWKASIKKIAEAELPIGSLTILRPIDREQGLTASRLAKQAQETGLPVSEVPIDEVVKKYGWSLGSFIAFLQELSFRKGIILGCDSMPAGHAGPAVGLKSVVLGSPFFNQTFFGPAKDSFTVMPQYNPEVDNFSKVTTEFIKPDQITSALDYITR